MFSGSHWLCGWIVRFAICASTGFICSFSDDCGSHHKNADASPLEAVALCEGGADEIVNPYWSDRQSQLVEGSQDR